MPSYSRPRIAPQTPLAARLTPKQERFAQCYVASLNATEAAAQAGYSPNGDLNSQGSQGTQLLAKPRVQARIAELQAARIKRTEVDSDFVLKRLIEEVNADAADLYDAEGRLKPVKDWPEAWRRGLVTTIRTTELFGRGKDRGTQIGVQTDVVLVDRARRLELLGKHIKVNAFAERVQLGMDTPLQELFKQISGQVIRPAIEHQAGEIRPAIDRDGADEAEILPAAGEIEAEADAGPKAMRRQRGR